MGFSGIGMSELLLILVIVMLIFGTKRLKTIGSDLGSAIKGFRSSMNAADAEAETPKPAQADTPAIPVSPPSSTASPLGAAPTSVHVVPDQAAPVPGKEKV